MTSADGIKIKEHLQGALFLLSDVEFEFSVEPARVFFQ